MYGVGQLTLGTVLTEARCRVTFIHERHNPLFGGRSPAPNRRGAAAAQLRDAAKRKYDLGLAMDGDADRIASWTSAASTSRSTTFCCCCIGTCTRCAASAAAWCATSPPRTCSTAWRSGWARSATKCRWASSTSSSTMVEHNALLGGESSGGLTIRGHILGQGRHLRLRAGGGDAGADRPEDFATAASGCTRSPAGCTTWRRACRPRRRCGSPFRGA